MKNLNRKSAANLTNLELFTECLSELSIFQPWDDYRELLELCIILLGGIEECVLAVLGQFTELDGWPELHTQWYMAVPKSVRIAPTFRFRSVKVSRNLVSGAALETFERGLSVYNSCVRPLLVSEPFFHCCSTKWSVITMYSINIHQWSVCRSSNHSI